jgi:hypothetical protein
MKTRHKVAATVGLMAIGAGGFCLRIGPRNASVDSPPTATAPAPLPPIGFTREVAATISKVELEQGEPRQELTLEREGTEWWVTSPVRVRASASKMTELLENLGGLKITEAVDGGRDAFEAYQLTEPKAFHVVAWDGASKVTDVYFGRSETLQRFMRIGDRAGVFAVANSGPGGYLGFLYTRELRSWRDASILHFDEGDVVEVEVTNQNGRFSFRKNGPGWSGTLTPRDRDGHLGPPDPAWPQFDESKVNDLLRAFRSLSADDFGEEAQRAGSGVDRADETGGILRIEFKGGAADRTLRVGKVSTNDGRWAIHGSHWATLDGDPALYVLAPWTAEWATADAGQFESPEEREGGSLTTSRATGFIGQH